MRYFYTPWGRCGTMIALCFIASSILTKQVHATPIEPCPLTAQENRIIVDLTPYTQIVSDTVTYPDIPYKTDSTAVSIPAGTYKVRLAAYDVSIDRKNLVPEPNERWYLTLTNNGQEIARTNPTADLEDGVDSIMLEEEVNSSLTLSSPANGAFGVQAVYPDTTSPNSLYPLCAAFDRIVSTPPPPNNNNNNTHHETATITLYKVVVNDNGGTKSASDFPLSIGGQTVTTGTAVTLAPGTYSASETSRSGYTSSGWSGDCEANGNVTLNAGDNKSCTIVNDDEAPSSGSSNDEHSSHHSSGRVAGASTQELICVPGTSDSVRVGDAVSWSARGGNGTYEWISLDTNNVATGDTYTRTYDTPGDKKVMLKSNDEIAVCSVTITGRVLGVSTPYMPNTGFGGTLRTLIFLAGMILVLAAIGLTRVHKKFDNRGV
jgi:hypothetical protein